MKTVRPLYVPSSADGAPEYLILRDGSTATIRPTEPGDLPAMQAFIDRLSPEAKAHRFFSETAPPATLVRTLCDSSDPRSQLTLVVVRARDGALRIIAAGSYFARGDDAAEVALAVDDDLHGKGLGTLLLERLALLAIRHGFLKLWAVTHADNLAMREVFRESGFSLQETFEGAEMEVELTLSPTEATVARSEVRERIATTASLRPFFQPRAVAIVGASRDPRSIGHRLLTAILGTGFKRPVYPVNPHATELDGLRVYPTMRDLPEAPDLAIIAVPRDAVLQVTRDCADRGVRALLVITAGFAEADARGRALQAELVELIRESGMRMIGPNCFGLVNTDRQVCLNATFSTVFPPAGRVAMSSQSGALGLAILAAARRLQLGISTFVSVGNKADVSGNDLLQYWEEDPQTDVVLLYLESFGNPRRFARIARRVSRRKPIIVVKAGRSSAGRRAAGSHTAALAVGDLGDVIADALFRQTGVIRADTLEELFALASGLANQPLPRGRRVAIVTNAGGPAVLCADACESGGLVVPELSAGIVERLREFLPESAAVKNPVDLIASATPDQYAKAIDTLLSDEDIDALIVLYISVDVADTDTMARGIVAGIQAAHGRGAKGKPVLACWMAEGDPDRGLIVNNEQIPIYPLPEMPARVLSKAAAYAEWRTKPLGIVLDFEDMDLGAAQRLCREALARRGTGWLTVDETRAVLGLAGLPLVAGAVAPTPQEAVSLAARFGYPVAVKLASHRLVHKTEVGGVHLNVREAEGVREAFAAIHAGVQRSGDPDAMDGVLIQPMLSGGVELMMGVTQDPLFGTLVAFGLGGIHVEILKDVRFRVTPLTDRDAQEMVAEIKGYRLLEGYRGHPPADITAIQETLLRLSRLVEAVPEIVELDLNPVFALPPGEGCRVADARIRVATSM